MITKLDKFLEEKIDTKELIYVANIFNFWVNSSTLADV
jgi:hypothetical protein